MPEPVKKSIKTPSSGANLDKTIVIIIANVDACAGSDANISFGTQWPITMAKPSLEVSGVRFASFNPLSMKPIREYLKSAPRALKRLPIIMAMSATPRFWSPSPSQGNSTRVTSSPTALPNRSAHGWPPEMTISLVFRTPSPPVASVIGAGIIVAIPAPITPCSIPGSYFLPSVCTTLRRRTTSALAASSPSTSDASAGLSRSSMNAS
mmetsp:Transcript_41529/g.96013  ORF Transcript_41529/g.96013 Transcript_41529/m.96013 type:complete len:208 (-) Transcript_41529:112-735(-)